MGIFRNFGSSVKIFFEPHEGDASRVQEQLTEGVSNIFTTNQAFAALKQDGTIVVWGNVHEHERARRKVHEFLAAHA